jgi:release factor glutamine methyltransferase
MTVAETVRLTKLRLERFAGEESDREAKLMVAEVIGAEAGALSVHTWMDVADEQLTALGAMIARREKGEPLQYILGEWAFMGLPFLTDRRALIPRQDTELLCETARERIASHGYRTVLDLCTGGGCIAIALQKLTCALVTGADISVDALALARENAALNEGEIAWIESDLFKNIPGRYDLIVCNPPYLSRNDMEHLQKEVAFEPALALFGGEDGLAFYRKIAGEYREHINPGGTLLLEIGYMQGESTAELFANGAKTRVLNDLCGNPRVLIVETDEQK